MAPTGFRLGEFVVEPATDRLVHVDTGARIELEPKTMDVLVALAERTGEVVSSSTLIDCVWHGRPMGDNPVYKAVAKLRRALNDDAAAPRYIETIPRRGYRLIMPPSEPVRLPARPVLEPRAAEPPEDAVSASLAARDTGARSAAYRSAVRHWRAALAIVALIATLSLWALHWPPGAAAVAKPAHPASTPAEPARPIHRT